MTRKTEETVAHPKANHLRRAFKADLTSQAWEATSPEEQAEAASLSGAYLKPQQKLVTPEEVHKHTIAEGTDTPSLPHGSDADTTLRGGLDHTGQINKENGR